MQPIKITQYASTSERGKFKEVTQEVKSLNPHELLLKMVACGVCHTDSTFMGTDGQVLGHEPVGKVVEVGSEVTKFKKGDLVGTSYLKSSCLDCRDCNFGNDYLCSKRVMFPEGNMNGFATHQVCDGRFAYKIPDGMEAKDAASLFCAGVTVFNALVKSNIPPTGRVAVVGIGGLGHLALQFARAWGVHVTALSHSPNKKEEAIGFGAHDFLSDKDLTPENIEKLQKYDLILDTVSASLDWDLYFSLLNPNATLVLMGLPDSSIEIKQPLNIIAGQKALRGGMVGGRYVVELMLEFAQRHNVKPQIEEYSFDLDGLHEAIDRCDKSKARYRAILVDKNA